MGKSTAGFLDGSVNIYDGDAGDPECAGLQRELDYFPPHFTGSSDEFIPDIH
jgi:hypothetical protein